MDLLRLGRLAEAWIAPPEIRELRELTRYRYKLSPPTAPPTRPRRPVTAATRRS